MSLSELISLKGVLVCPVQHVLLLQRLPASLLQEQTSEQKPDKQARKTLVTGEELKEKLREMLTEKIIM